MKTKRHMMSHENWSSEAAGPFACVEVARMYLQLQGCLTTKVHSAQRQGFQDKAAVFLSTL